MIDEKVIAQLIERQITEVVSTKVLEYFNTDEWAKPIERQVVNYIQERLLQQFSEPNVMPLVIESVKKDVAKIFAKGNIPNLEKFVDPVEIKQGVEIAVENTINQAIDHLGQDPDWVAKIENMINQTVVQKTLSRISGIDVNSVIHQQVNKKLEELQESIVERFVATGIQATSDKIELTLLDDHVVVENELSTKSLNVINTANIKNLSVTGTINVDNRSWNELSDSISQKTLDSINEQWKDQLVKQVADIIKDTGINFNEINIDGSPLVKNGVLSSNIINSKLQTLGVVKELTVSGEARVCDTLSISPRRVGINTSTPEMALSIWDEDVTIIAGRLKQNVAYVGTSRNQNLFIGVNRTPAIEINTDGLTTVKKLQIGVHRVSHGTTLPGYAGTRGDIVFNVNINANTDIFAWMCLGGHNWKELKTL